MPNHNVVLTSVTGRIKLIPPHPSEDEAVAQLRTHPEFLRYLPIFPQSVSAEEMGQRREARSQNPSIRDFHIHVADYKGQWEFGGITGYFNLETVNKSCEIGVAVCPALYGTSIATDVLYTLLVHVFEEQRLHRATFQTAAANVAMRGWLDKVADAKLEGEKRECWRTDKETYCDVACYSILEWEWRDKVKGKLEHRLQI
ncbi:acyl-CoA N-acyltransferase [Guyanagaster necrorhizus]|uniref:Acyl-CoA N-acyltransferase n=1 Tax=Guyanagaster necrorhizus TaxID=856835 RepID=A0A9P7VRR3_9AGAR|nr:acyl-CoA N-acyltransferase [Guyanagaster necrorhizus MCA 3950]KAG7446218.1 acyl-CoA N-acyltransferase [Guyanagaster necrorhizus MCA 3950]